MDAETLKSQMQTMAENGATKDAVTNYAKRYSLQADGSYQEKGTFLGSGLVRALAEPVIQTGEDIGEGGLHAVAGAANLLGDKKYAQTVLQNAKNAQQTGVSFPGIGTVKPDTSIPGFFGSALETATLDPELFGAAKLAGGALKLARPTVDAAEGISDITKGIKGADASAAGTMGKAAVSGSSSVASATARAGKAIAKDALTVGVPYAAGGALKDMGNNSTDAGTTAVNAGTSMLGTILGSTLFHGAGAGVSALSNGFLKTEAGKALTQGINRTLTSIKQSTPELSDEEANASKELKTSTDALYQAASQKYDAARQSIASGAETLFRRDPKTTQETMRGWARHAEDAVYRDIDKAFAPISKNTAPVSDLTAVKNAIDAAEQKVDPNLRSPQFQRALDESRALVMAGKSSTKSTVQDLYRSAFSTPRSGNGVEDQALTGLAKAKLDTIEGTFKGMGAEGKKLLDTWDKARNFNTDARISLSDEYMNVWKDTRSTKEAALQLAKTDGLTKVDSAYVDRMKSSLGAHFGDVKDMVWNHLLSNFRNSGVEGNFDAKALREQAANLGRSGFLTADEVGTLHELADIGSTDFRQFLAKANAGDSSVAQAGEKAGKDMVGDAKELAGLKDKVKDLGALSSKDASEVAWSIAHMNSSDAVKNIVSGLDDKGKKLLQQETVRSLLSNAFSELGRTADNKYNLSKFVETFENLGGHNREENIAQIFDQPTRDALREVDAQVTKLANHTQASAAKTAGALHATAALMQAATGHLAGGAIYHGSAFLASLANKEGMTQDEMVQAIKDNAGQIAGEVGQKGKAAGKSTEDIVKEMKAALKEHGKIPRSFWIGQGLRKLAPLGAIEGTEAAQNLDGTVDSNQ